MNSSVVSTVGVSPVQSAARSFVMRPEEITSRQERSSALANSASAGIPSSSPRFASAPVQAKMVAIGFVEVFSPRR